MANEETGDVRSDNSDPTHGRKSELRRKIGMTEEQIKEKVRIVKLMRRISPAGDALTFEQALRLAERNAEIYRRFLASKIPINALEVRVGPRKIFGAKQNRVDGIQELTEYRRSLPEDTVLQILRPADKQFDEVPLLFQDLEGIPLGGVSTTKRYPNGQVVTLYVMKELNNEFNIKLSFAAAPETLPKPPQVFNAEDLKQQTSEPKPKAKAAFLKSHRRSSDSKRSWLGSIYVPVQAYTYGMRAMASVLVICAIFTAFCLGSHRSYGKAQRLALIESGQQMLITDVSESTWVGESELISRVERNTLPPDAGMTKAAVQAPVAPSAIWRREMGHAIVSSEPELLIDSFETHTLAVTSETARRGETGEQGETATPKFITSWDKQCEAMLAKLRRVYVEDLTDPSVDNDARLRVRTEFVRVLTRQGIKVLEKGEKEQAADAIVHLRFEPDKTASGAVFAELRNSAGQYIWDDKAGCETTVNGNLDTILSNASRRLGILMVVAIQQAQRNVDNATESE